MGDCTHRKIIQGVEVVISAKTHYYHVEEDSDQDIERRGEAYDGTTGIMIKIGDRDAIKLTGCPNCDAIFMRISLMETE